ncbi:DUF3892 domain-containing protein [Nocardia sp. NPDC059246]|uniref:DUF3892 domain-containing protein n=1 Tax=unclassified Nocardia TaxID=2637762 RepID=UPI00367638E5
MAIRITAIHLEGGYTHEHITQLKWEEQGKAKRGTDSRAKVVAWVESGVKAYVYGSPAPRVEVGVVNPSSRPKYLRTHADGVWTNNLLNLPKF